MKRVPGMGQLRKHRDSLAVLDAQPGKDLR